MTTPAQEQIILDPIYAIELNHDYAGEILKNPDDFMRLIKETLNSGVNCNPENERGEQVIHELKRFGVTVTPTSHHSQDRAVVIDGRDYRL